MNNAKDSQLDLPIPYGLKYHGIAYRCRFDANWTMLYIGNEIEQLSSYPASDFVENKVRTYESIIHPEDAVYVSKVIHEAVQAGRPWEVEYRIIRKDSAIAWVLERGSYMNHDESKCSTLDGFLLDITQSKTNYFELKEKKEQFELAIKGTHDGIWDWDLRNNHLFLSKRWKAMLGYSDDELTNEFSTFIRLIHEKDSERVGKYVQQYLNGEIEKYAIEFRMKHKDGGFRWILAKGEAIRSPEGKPCRMAGSHSDITERKETEEALEASKDFLNNIFNSVQDGLIVLLNDLSITHVNQSIYRWFPETSEFIGKKCYQAFHGLWEPCTDCPALKAVAAGASVVREKQVKPSEHSCFWWEVSVYPLRDKAGNLIGVIENIKDITDRKKYEHDLLKAKEQAEVGSKAKSEFLANMSHEIRTPLNGVIGFTDLLLKTPLNEVQRQYTENANISGQALLGIISDILDFSKIEAGKLELEIIQTDIIELVEQASDIIKYHASQKNLEVLLNINPNIPNSAWVDPIRLKQILINLLNNAVKFTERGEIELKLEFIPLDKNLGHYTFSVRDTGIGISEAQQQKLFKAFSQADASTTRKYGGTGLGLIISNLLTTKMGGEISLISSLGQGSTFTFTILCPYTSTTEHPLFEPLRPAKVLVVDDNHNNRQILEHNFAWWGLTFTGCENGPDAIQLLEKNPDFDAVIVDYHMPYIDGLETIRLIREKLGLGPEKLPIIMLHSSAENQCLRDECKKLEVKFNLTKPVKAKELYHFLSNIRSKPSPLTKPVDEISKEKSEQKSFDSEQRQKILLVEDSSMNMLLAKSLLHSIMPNLMIMEADNGLDAVKISIEQAPQLVLMDIQMPGLDGVEATMQIRKHEKESGYHLPIVALTAGALKEEKERCLAAGMDDFLTKPIDIETLKAVLEKYLVRPHSENHSLSFDRNALMKRVGQNPTLYYSFLEISKNMPVKISSLKKAMESADSIEIIRSAHTIKGTASMISFKHLAKLAESIEENDDLNSDELQLVLEKLKNEWNKLSIIVEAELKNKPLTNGETDS